MSTIKRAVATTAVQPALKSAAAKLQVAGSAINTSKLTNLKEKLDGISTDRFDDAGTRFQESAFGRVVSSPDTGGASGLEHMAGDGRSKNPLDNQPSQMKTGREAVSDDPAASESSSTWEAAKNWFLSVIGSGASGAGAKGATGNGAGAVGGTAWGILTANGTPEEKKNEANGIIGLFRQGAKGTSNEEASGQLEKALKEQDELGSGGEPLPENPSGSTRTSGRHVDPSMLAPLKRDSQSEYPDTGTSSGGGGPVNTGANGTGGVNTRAEFVGDKVSSAVTRFDAIGLEARRFGNITVIK